MHLTNAESFVYQASNATKKLFHYPQNSQVQLLCTQILPLLPHSLTDPFSIPIVLPFLGCHLKEIIDVGFEVLLLSAF